MSDLRYLIEFSPDITTEEYETIGQMLKDKKFRVVPGPDAGIENVETAVYGLWDFKEKRWAISGDGKILCTRYLGVAKAQKLYSDSGYCTWEVMEIGKDGKPVLWDAVETDDNSQSD